MNLWGRLVENLKFMQVIVAIFATTAALKTLAWPAISNAIFATPAITIHSITMSRAITGKKSFVILAITKFRPCLPKSAVVNVIDSNGVLTVSDLSWDLPLPLGTSTVRFYWTPPDTIAQGVVKQAKVEVWHNECQDGPSPKEPAIAQANILEIAPNE